MKIQSLATQVRFVVNKKISGTSQRCMILLNNQRGWELFVEQKKKTEYKYHMAPGTLSGVIQVSRRPEIPY